MSEISEKTVKILGYFGRLISGSKSYYVEKYPDRKPIFNANIISKTENQKIWYGDVDLVSDDAKLKRLVEEIGEFAIVRESQGRFENENIKYSEAEKVAVAIYKL